MGKLALVLSGGGARGAYEAGIIHYIRTGLPKEFASKNFDICCGSSAGAINIAAFVSMAQDPLLQGNRIKELWLSLKQENIYERNLSAAFHFVSTSLGGILRNLTTWDPFKLGQKAGPHFTSLVNTKPLHHFLAKNVSWDQIHKNIHQGPIAAMSITVTNTRTGYSELFISKKREVSYTGDYRSHEVNFEPEHIMASAAIPIFFPPVKVGKAFYTDGSLRLFTPLSPAIQLGANRALVIGLRHRVTPEEKKAYEEKEVLAPPSLAELLGRIMNGLFMDRLQYDMEQLTRINHLIEWSEKVYGKDYLDQINTMIQKEGITGDVASRGLQRIRVVEITPSEFVSQIFGRWFKRKNKGSFSFSAMEKLLTRVLDVDTEGGIELLSYLTFAKDYLKELIDLGYEDAKKNRDKIMELMTEKS